MALVLSTQTLRLTPCRSCRHLYNCYRWNRTIPSRLRRLLHPCTLSSLRIHIYFTHCLSSAHNDPPPHYCYRKSLVCYVYMYSSTAFATTVKSEWQALLLRPLAPKTSVLLTELHPEVLAFLPKIVDIQLHSLWLLMLCLAVTATNIPTVNNSMPRSHFISMYYRI